MSIVVASTLTWNFTGNSTAITMNAFNGYVTTATDPGFITNPNAILGDIYMVVSANSGLIFSVSSGQHIAWGLNSAHTSITAAGSGCSYALICVDATPGSQLFRILSTNGITFS